MWVWDKAYICHVVCVLRHTIFEPKGHDVESDNNRTRFGEEFCCCRGQIVNVKFRSIQDHFCVISQLGDERSFGRDTFQNRAVTLQWVWSTQSFEPANKSFV